MKATEQTIPTVTVSELLTQCEMSFDLDDLTVVVGRPGGGKSTIAVQIGQALGYRVVVLNLSGAGPQEASGYGVPSMSEHDGQPVADMIFSAPELFPLLRKIGDEKVLLVLDEFSNWDKTVQSLFHGCYAVDGFKRIGTHVLGPNVRVLATANSKEHGSTISAVLSAPMVNRGVTFELVPCVTDWVTWFDSKHGSTGNESFVPAFLQFGDSVEKGGDDGTDGPADHFNPPVPKPWDGRPHPSPRAWENVAKCEHRFRDSHPKAFADRVLGYVGHASGAAYLNFLKHADRIPAAKEWQAGNVTMPKDPGEQYAMANAALVIAQKQCEPDRYGVELHKGSFDWLAGAMADMRGDIATWAYNSAINRGIPMAEHPDSGKLTGVK